MFNLGRRGFITLIGGAAVAWPFVARGQQPAMPVIAFLHPGASEIGARDVTAFRKGLQETGYIEGQNTTIEYHWLEGQYDQLPALVSDLIRRPLAVIAIPGSVVAARAAKAATATIPIVFQIGDDPVHAGLVASLGRPGGNVTGVTSLNVEITPKRLRLLHELVPKAARVAVLVNPANATATEIALRDLREAAPIIGLQIEVLKATTIAEIDTAFAMLARERPDALFVGPDGFFASRRVQFAILAARERIPAAYTQRGYVAAGGLMSYGSDQVEMIRQLGGYTGSILKGAKPADLPVLQSRKLEFVINIQTARALGLEVPPTLLAVADEVIE
jgi:putative tryptophan/tyrosine transport system substrate-binding protein